MTSSQRIWVGPLDAEAAREVAAQGAAAHVAQVLEEVRGFAYGLQWLGERLLREGDVDEECTDRRLVRVEDAERVHDSRRGRHRRGRIGMLGT